ncbi:MAG: 2-dehydropantoate 2-reductase [Alphaproteobacteria bacterium]|nr:2-dehydropantoate 2-reductase [Alphaproteobacteria bacterium]
MKFDSRIVIAGAGSVGCYLGGCLAAAGRNVMLVLREPLAEALSADGLRISDLGGGDEIIPPASFELATDAAAAFADADVVLATVKCRHTRDIAELIAAHAPERTVVLSLQNGVGNAAVLQEIVEPRHVVAGMIPFNVVQTRKDGESPRFHRASSGTIQIGHGIEGLRALLNVPGVPVAEHADIDALLWSKLLVNLNNALNALSDLPLAKELGDRRWRLLLRRQMYEGLAVLRAAGIYPTRIEGVPPRLIAFALRLRDPIFGLVAGRMLAVDPLARSSMWEDLEARRPTEIDYIQGEIVRLAESHGVPVPLNRRVMDCIKAAEGAAKGSPRLTPAAIKAGL